MMLNSKIADMASVARSLPLGRMGNPVEVANLVTWLATDAASYVIGQVTSPDGASLPPDGRPATGVRVARCGTSPASALQHY
jgi:NAD(P)-dependent dehydrogenase (short-subunit alcohol dehydrogenase family)